jgi:hypothetical protein
VSTVSTMTMTPEPRFFPVAPPGRVMPPVTLLVTGWVLFALALGAGVLVGWAIWG